MKRNNSIRHRLRLLLFMSVLVTLSITVAFMGNEMWQITQNVSEEYARLYTKEFVSDFQAILSREIGLSLKVANSHALKNWLKDEANLDLKRMAFEEVNEANQIFQDQNFFIAIENSRQMYFTDAKTPYGDFEPNLSLSEEEAQDIWYFNTLASSEAYMLNIDVDRYLNSMRVWVNVKVIDDQSGEPLGIVGTGLYLDPLIQSVFTQHQKFGAKTFVVNEYGAIQLDSDIENIMENSFSAHESLEKTLFQYNNDATFRTKIEGYFENPNAPMVIQMINKPFQYAAIAPIRDTKWHVITFFSINALYDVTSFLPIILIVIGTILFMGVLLNLIFNHQFVLPFQKLRESIQLKDLLQEEVLFGLDREDEFGVLAKTIQQMTERLMHSVSVGMFIIAQDFTLIYVNPYFLEQFGCESKNDFIKYLESHAFNLFKHKEDFDWASKIFEEAPDQYATEVELVDIKGMTFWADIRLTKIDGGNGTWHYEGILINIQKMKENVRNLTQLAEIDKLTGLYNRNYFDTLLSDITLDRNATQQSLVVFDLDNFKQVNDRWGHDVGDAVLRETAQIAKSILRTTDVLIRWGGEEFAILMNETDASGAMIAAEKLRKELSTHMHIIPGIVTASFGVAQRLPHELYFQWFKRADIALYAAKNAGKNRVVLAEAQKNMSFLNLQWRSSFNSGNAMIDEQHFELFQSAEKLIDIATQSSDFTLIKNAFDALIAQTLAHFDDEIVLLKSTKFPVEEIAAHHFQHQQLATQMITWQKQLSEGDAKPLVALASFLQELVVDHMLKEDIKFFGYLK